MLLQTNSYVVPKDKRSEHARLVRRFRQTLGRLGCDHFEAFEQTGSNWGGEATGRFVQIMRFRDRRHQQQVQQAERTDAAAQALIREFCDLINFPYQQQQGLFAVGFYTSVLPTGTGRAGVQQAEGAAPPASPAEPTPRPPPPMTSMSALAPVQPHPSEPTPDSGLAALEALAVEDLPDEPPAETPPQNGELFRDEPLGADDTSVQTSTPAAPAPFDEPIARPDADRLAR